MSDKIMLYTISTSTQSRIHWQLISSNDAVLFWQNGVLLGLNNHSVLGKILEKTLNCYILDSDILARGLTGLIDPRLQIIDMQKAVALTARYYPQINWND